VNAWTIEGDAVKVLDVHGGRSSEGMYVGREERIDDSNIMHKEKIFQPISDREVANLDKLDGLDARDFAPQRTTTSRWHLTPKMLNPASPAVAFIAMSPLSRLL
jgi:hypothetical protein